MMFTREEYQKLKEKYGAYSSWAIWNYKDSNDTLVIEENLDQLNSRYVILGLNISASLSNTSWSNFHSGRHDRKLKYALNDSLLRGSYISDIFKDIPEPDSGNLDLLLTEKIIKENVRFFNNELRDIKLGHDSQFIILGAKTAKYFDKYFKLNYKNKCIYINHYSSRGTDREWVEKFWQKLNINLNFDSIIQKYK